MSERECSFTNSPPVILTPLFWGGGVSVLFVYKPRHYPPRLSQLPQVNQFWGNAIPPNYGEAFTSFLMKSSSLVAGPSQDTRLPGEGVPGRGRATGSELRGGKGPSAGEGDVSGLCTARTPVSTGTRTHLDTVHGT